MVYLNDKKGFVKDFFNRTKKIIEDFENSNHKEYEVTFLCNCLIGILIFPEQKFFDEMKTISLSEENWGKLQNGLMGTYKPNNTQDLFRRARNAITHCNIKFESETSYDFDNQIKYMYLFDDRKHNGKKLKDYEFQLRIDVKDLKNILYDFCEKCFGNEE